jgi:hypothetical protein
MSPTAGDGDPCLTRWIDDRAGSAATAWNQRSSSTRMLAIVPDHDYHEREISVSVWGHALVSTRIARLHQKQIGEQ